MSEQKKPQAGEWWFANDGSGRVYIIGQTTADVPVYEFKEGAVSRDSDWCNWHHEPLCTGWDWKSEPLKPAEDPDEWVTQDRVPARPLIDERRWVNQRGQGYGIGWVTVGKGGLCGMKHGDVSNGDRLELRCRRKDLPPLPQQPKTETVTFHEVVMWRDGTRKLELIECPSEACVGTGRTETRTIKGSL